MQTKAHIPSRLEILARLNNLYDEKSTHLSEQSKLLSAYNEHGKALSDIASEIKELEAMLKP